MRAEAPLPYIWELGGLMPFGNAWIAFANGPGADDHLEASGTYAAVDMAGSDGARLHRSPLATLDPLT